MLKFKVKVQDLKVSIKRRMNVKIKKLMVAKKAKLAALKEQMSKKIQKVHAVYRAKVKKTRVLFKKAFPKMSAYKHLSPEAAKRRVDRQIARSKKLTPRNQ